MYFAEQISGFQAVILSSWRGLVCCCFWVQEVLLSGVFFQSNRHRQSLLPADTMPHLLLQLSWKRNNSEIVSMELSCDVGKARQELNDGPLITCFIKHSPNPTALEIRWRRKKVWSVRFLSGSLLLKAKAPLEESPSSRIDWGFKRSLCDCLGETASTPKTDDVNRWAWGADLLSHAFWYRHCQVSGKDVIIIIL